VMVRLGLFDDFVGWRPLGEWAVGIVNLFPDVQPNGSARTGTRPGLALSRR
jgi:hypothetical protein